MKITTLKQLKNVAAQIMTVFELRQYALEKGYAIPLTSVQQALKPTDKARGVKLIGMKKGGKMRGQYWITRRSAEDWVEQWIRDNGKKKKDM